MSNPAGISCARGTTDGLFDFVLHSLTPLHPRGFVGNFAVATQSKSSSKRIVQTKDLFNRSLVGYGRTVHGPRNRMTSGILRSRKKTSFVALVHKYGQCTNELWSIPENRRILRALPITQTSTCLLESESYPQSTASMGV